MANRREPSSTPQGDFANGQSFAVCAPQVSSRKGAIAIRGIGEKNSFMQSKVFATSIGAVGALLFSFAAVANPLTVKAVEARTAIAAAPGEQTRAAILTEINGAFVSGDRIGEVRAGTDCSEVVEREWSDLIRQRVALDVPRVFSEQLAIAHYTASEHSRGKPLEVSAFVNGMDLKICRAEQGTWHGGIYVQVSWQVRSPETGRIVYQASTEGSYILGEPRRVSAAAGLREAFAVSVRNLLADRRFAALLQHRDADGHVAAVH